VAPGSGIGRAGIRLGIPDGRGEYIGVGAAETGTGLGMAPLPHSMSEWARENVPLLTALSSVAALAVVFGAVGGAIPSALLPRASDAVLAAIPHFNAAVSATAIATILLGWRAISRGNVERHRNFMVTSFALFTAFLGAYLYRLIHVGTTEFPGPEAVYTYLYLPFLGIHILLAILCLPFVFYALLLAATRPFEELYHTRHAQVGLVAAVLWLISFTMGIGVYVMLYHAF
jgi:putative membrane protein